MAKNVKKPEVQRPAEPQQDEALPLGQVNFIMIAVSVLLIVLGFVLMAGSANVGETFNADIFSATRTLVGPMLSLAGFVLVVPSIIWRPKKKVVVHVSKEEVEQ